jgi:CheY-like chemotaxis protein
MKKVLIVEDDLGTRKVLAKAVESLGHTSIQASSGSRALGVLSDNRDIALLVTDYMMPDLDGKMLVRTLRSDPSVPKLPIIMVSGVVRLDEISSVLELGVDRFISKPVNIEEFKGYVTALLAD